MALRRVILQGEDAWLVVRAAPPTRETWIRRATELRCTLLPPSADADDIRATLVASDVMVNYSNIGETFGLALAEGMAVGLPVIVNSTPSLDNAQVEHCRHGETGLVANSPAAIAAALRYFAARRHLGRLMGEAGRRLIATRFAPASVDARLRVFMRRRLAAVGDSLAAAVPVPDAYVETYPLDEAWLAEHEQRSRTTFDEPGGELRRLADALEVRARGASDTLTYSRSIGLVGFARAAASRLRAGSLQRG